MMKVWIGHRSNRYVEIFPRKPKAEWWDNESKMWREPLSRLPVPEMAAAICRSVIARLLRGTAKELPKLNTNELVEVELDAR